MKTRDHVSAMLRLKALGWGQNALPSSFAARRRRCVAGLRGVSGVLIPRRRGRGNSMSCRTGSASVFASAKATACPEVNRKITKAAGYRWRSARIVLTSSDPN
jgi:hypothetical protein